MSLCSCLGMENRNAAAALALHPLKLLRLRGDMCLHLGRNFRHLDLEPLPAVLIAGTQQGSKSKTKAPTQLVCSP